VILAACHLAGGLAARLSQPRVIGEILAGVLLGPSALGAVWPAGYRWLFPAYLLPSVNLLAQLGLIFFMFAVGREMNPVLLRGRRCAAAVVSHVSIALPFLSGIGLALAMYRTLAGGVPFGAFALFLAVSMSVTAFPVLARILTDRGLSGTPLGTVALTCAAVDDATAWCLLGLVSAIAGRHPAGGVAVTAAGSVAFAALMLWVVRPALARLLDPPPGRRALGEPAVLPVLLGGVMLSALATSTIGIHPIFGAFLFGTVTPRGDGPVHTGSEQIRTVTGTLLLPLFFVYIGLHTRFGLLGAEVRLWAWCALVTAVAVAGKAAGTAVAARLTHTGWRDALCLGVLMNCRGLTELVVLSVGLQLRVITPTVFAMLVIMTLVSTVLTAPALSVLERLEYPRIGA
jgi:Kef-type K+ transport system membrane component KefB